MATGNKPLHYLGIALAVFVGMFAARLLAMTAWAPA
jgi:hypothetical protein